MDEGGGEMRFSLPAAPSLGPLLFLLAACRELARAGGHTTGAVAVQLLEWELGNAVLQAFRCSMHDCVHMCVRLSTPPPWQRLHRYPPNTIEHNRQVSSLAIHAGGCCQLLCMMDWLPFIHLNL